MAICILYNFVIYTFVSTFFYTYYEIDHSYTLCSRALLNSNFVVFWVFFFRKKVDKFTCGDSRVCLIAPMLPESLTDLGNVSMLSEWQWIQWMISKRVKHKKHLKKKKKAISYTWDSEGFFCKECLTYTLRNDHNKNVCRILKGNFVWFHQV